MTTRDEALAAAIEHLQAGRAADAAAVARHVLAAEPAHAQALHLLGVIEQQAGRPASAIGLFERALATAGDDLVLLVNLGAAYMATGNYRRAAETFGRVTAVAPDFALAHYNRGSALHALSEFDAAEAAYREALRLDPNCVEALVNLGDLLKMLGRLDEALDRCRHAVELRPSLAAVWLARGNVCQAQGRSDEAIADFRAALDRDADYAEAHNNLGMALDAQKKHEEALPHFRRAHELMPSAVGVMVNLASNLERHGLFDEAAAVNRRILALDPRQVRAHFGLGTIAQSQNRLHEALAHYDAAVAIDPDYAVAHQMRATAWLALGDFARGWPEMEWRFRCASFPRREFDTPAWDGSPLAGRRLLLHSEQGLGDMLQFVRYAQVMVERGADVVLDVPDVLVPLLTQSRVPGLPRAGQAIQADVHASLMSMPYFCGTTLENIPAEIPYLAADPALVDAWRPRLAARDGFKVGIAWQGSKLFRYDVVRSIPLVHYAPLADVPGVRLISLQKHGGSEQLAELAGVFRIDELGADFDVAHGPFMDTAAVMRNLDLIITSDTALAHLAGGLGVEVWVALSSAPEWRWMTQRADSPWYPTMRLFRQRQPGDWRSVFLEIQAELGRRVASQPARRQ